MTLSPSRVATSTASSIKVATFRGSLVGLLRELSALRESSSSENNSDAHHLPWEACARASSYHGEDDPCTEQSLEDRLERAREAEARNILEARNTRISEENAELQKQTKQLKKDIAHMKNNLQVAMDTNASEQTRQAVLTTLINSLQANHSEMNLQLATLDSEKTACEGAVSSAETAVAAALEALRSKDQEIMQLLLENTRQSDSLKKIDAEICLLQTTAEQTQKSLDETQGKLIESQAENARLHESYLEQKLQIKAMNQETRNVEERSSATTQALFSVSEKLKNAMAQHEKDRAATQVELDTLRVASIESKQIHKILESECESERIARQSLESERDALTEELSTKRHENQNLLQQQKCKEREFDSLMVKHERLLTAKQMKKPLCSSISTMSPLSPAGINTIRASRQNLAFDAYRARTDRIRIVIAAVGTALSGINHSVH